MNKYSQIFLSALGIVVLDQVTKYLAKTLLSTPIVLASFLQLKFTTNTGAAFSLFSKYPELLMWLSIIIIGAVFYYLDRLVDELPAIPLGLIIGGAFGNLADRIFLGRVTDFIALSFWPTFNVADSSIFIGVAAIIVVSFRKSKDKKKNTKS